MRRHGPEYRRPLRRSEAIRCAPFYKRASLSCRVPFGLRRATTETGGGAWLEGFWRGSAGSHVEIAASEDPARGRLASGEDGCLHSDLAGRRHEFREVHPTADDLLRGVVADDAEAWTLDRTCCGIGELEVSRCATVLICHDLDRSGLHLRKRHAGE